MPVVSPQCDLFEKSLLYTQFGMVSRFVPPFSLSRMTWIKPSFLWLMERSNWGKKSGQEMILAICIIRDSVKRNYSLVEIAMQVLSFYLVYYPLIY